MGSGVEARFERYADLMVQALGHADRQTPERWRKNRRVPSFNFDREQSLKSMEKIAAIMKDTGAEFWINHDKAQSDAILNDA